MEKRFVIWLKGELIDVTEEVYKAYYSHRRKERTQRERDARNRLVHYDAWDTGEGTGAESIASGDCSPEELVALRMDSEKLIRCVEMLNEEEREIIHALFYCGESLSALARRLCVPRKTLEGRRDKILRRLRIRFDAPER